MIIKDILLSGLTTIHIDSTMLEAYELMKQKNFRHLPVSDGKKLVGILSDRDVSLSKVMGPQGKKEAYIHPHKKVSEFMSFPIHKAQITDSLEKVTREMINLRVSCLVVEDDDGRDIGVITTEDLLIILLDQLQKKHGIFERVSAMFRLKHSTNS